MTIIPVPATSAVARHAPPVRATGALEEPADHEIEDDDGQSDDDPPVLPLHERDVLEVHAVEPGDQSRHGEEVANAEMVRMSWFCRAATLFS